jgi:hypothetical protein
VEQLNIEQRRFGQHGDLAAMEKVVLHRNLIQLGGDLPSQLLGVDKAVLRENLGVHLNLQESKRRRGSKKSLRGRSELKEKDTNLFFEANVILHRVLLEGGLEGKHRVIVREAGNKGRKNKNGRRHKKEDRVGASRPLLNGSNEQEVVVGEDTAAVVDSVPLFVGKQQPLVLLFAVVFLKLDHDKVEMLLILLIKMHQDANNSLVRKRKRSEISTRAENKLERSPCVRLSVCWYRFEPKT